jgi:hypothetical protein
LFGVVNFWCYRPSACAILPAVPALTCGACVRAAPRDRPIPRPLSSGSGVWHGEPPTLPPQPRRHRIITQRARPAMERPGERPPGAQSTRSTRRRGIHGGAADAASMAAQRMRRSLGLGCNVESKCAWFGTVLGQHGKREAEVQRERGRSSGAAATAVFESHSDPAFLRNPSVSSSNSFRGGEFSWFLVMSLGYFKLFTLFPIPIWRPQKPHCLFPPIAPDEVSFIGSS